MKRCMMDIPEKYLLVLKELLYETSMDQLANDPKLINQAYQMLLKFGALSEVAIIRKFKVSNECASKIMQGFRDEQLMDKFGRLIDQRVSTT
jgi:hypothetical protein